MEIRKCILRSFVNTSALLKSERQILRTARKKLFNLCSHSQKSELHLGGINNSEDVTANLDLNYSKATLATAIPPSFIVLSPYLALLTVLTGPSQHHWLASHRFLPLLSLSLPDRWWVLIRHHICRTVHHHCTTPGPPLYRSSPSHTNTQSHWFVMCR